MDSLAQLQKKFWSLIDGRSKEGHGWKSDLAKDLGVSRSYISHLFKRRRKPSLTVLARAEKSGLLT